MSTAGGDSQAPAQATDTNTNQAEPVDEPVVVNDTIRQRRALCIISVGIFSALSIWFSASAVLAPLSKNWGISGTEGSFLTSMVNIGFVVGCTTLALTGLADHFTPQLLICVGSVGAGLSNLGLLLAAELASGLLCRLFVGMFLSLVYPPGVKLLCSWSAPQHRSTATGIMFGAFCLGSAFPQLLKGLVGPESWRLVVLVTSSASLVSGCALFALVGTGPHGAPQTAGAKQPITAKKCLSVLGNRRVVLSILAYSGHMWELFCVWAWCATFVERSWRLSDSVAPIVAFAVISFGGPGSWLGGIFGDRYGRVRVAVASLATSGVCIGVIGLLAHEGPLPVRIILALVWGFAAMSDSPQFSSIITISAPPGEVGTAVTLQMTCGYLITVLALWTMPQIASSVSWRWSFFSLVAGPLVSLVALYCMEGRKMLLPGLDETSTPPSVSTSSPGVIRASV